MLIRAQGLPTKDESHQYCPPPNNHYDDSTGYKI